MGTIEQLRQWFATHKNEIKKDYFDFLRFRSISADPDCKDQILLCAEWLKQYLLKGNFHAELIATQGYPVVYAWDLAAGVDKPTVLIYGHYDVQPIDPIELWHSDPFEPVEREGNIYARGAVDDKGQIFYAVLAAIVLKRMKGQLPINLKFCIEGEEESSSVGLSKALPELKEKMKADYLIVVDFDQFDKETPAVSLGCRGMLGIEVSLRGSRADLHSGMYGGIAYNPNRALVELLAKLWDSEGKVQVPGFYDEVEEIEEATRKQYDGHFEKKKYTKEFGIEAFGGEAGRSLQETNTLRPTLELNGICGGYCGAGIKTVIPAESKGKITCRLVPNQNPEKIGQQIIQFLENEVKEGMKMETQIHPGAFAFRTNPHTKLVRALAQAAEEVCGKKCKRTLSGASIPIVPELIAASGAEMVGMGYGLIDDEIHAPNEKFDFLRLEKGFLTLARTLEIL